MKPIVFTGAATAIVTPMNDDFSVNYTELERLINWQIAQKIDAIVVCGTTGEASTLWDEEHIQVIKAAVKYVGGRVPVIAGVGSNNTEYAVWHSQEAEKVGADALLHVTPYYNKTSQTGLIKHFNTVADATDLPVILYNVPGRTGLHIQPRTYQELAKHPKIVATKEASGNISDIARTRMLCGDDLAIYAGNDDQIVPLMSLGGLGVISVLSNIMPLQVHDLCKLYLEGQVKESAALQIQLMDIADALFCDVNPIPVKTALNLMGYKTGRLRMPLVELGESGMKQLKAAMKTHQLI